MSTAFAGILRAGSARSGARSATRPAARIEYRIAFAAIVLLLGGALLYPIATVFWQSVVKDGAFTLSHWTTLLAKPSFREMIGNSFLVAGLSALCSAVIAFFAAYGLTFSNVHPKVKRLMHVVLLLPLFFPRSRTALRSFIRSAAWGS